MSDSACSVPWGGLIVVLACIAVVALTYMSLSAARVSKLQRWDNKWRQWQRRLQRDADDAGLGAPTAPEPTAHKFLEHIVQRRHPGLAVRRSKHAAKSLPDM